ESNAHVVKPIGKHQEDVIQLAAPRGFMRSDQLIIGAPNLFVELNVGRAAQASPLRVLVKNAADKERIISDVSAKQKRLLGRGASESNQDVGNVFVGAIVDLGRTLELVRARKSFQERSNVIAKFAVADSSLLQNVPGENIEIKL